MTGADYALFPIPGIAADGSLYAPEAENAIVPGPALLELLKPGAAVVLGRADDNLRRAAAEGGVVLVEYEDDTALMLERGPAIVEGALAVAITNSPLTVHASTVGVVGFGTIGSLLARGLRSLGATVHVFARNPVQRAAAYAGACSPHALGDLATVAPGLVMLFSTVPVQLVGPPVLEALPPGSLVVDIAAPPGSIDLEAAKQLGHTAVWARGLGRSAPVTVGKSQWGGIARRIAEHERRKVAHES
jgi:dipicolinate synthase subunit A